MDSKRFLQQISKYAISGSDYDLEQLCFVCNEFQDIDIAVEDVIPSRVLQQCVSRLVDSLQFQHLRQRGWHCLYFLSDDDWFTGAARMLTDFSSLEGCRQLLAYCATVLKNGENRELVYCVAFLDKFVHDSKGRTKAVYYDPELRGALYGYLENRFAKASSDTQLRALCLVVNILNLFQSAHSDQEAFFGSGAFHAVKCAAMHVFYYKLTEDETEVSRMKQAMIALETTLYIASRVRGDAYQLSRKDMRRICITGYYLMSNFWAERWLVDVASFLLRYSDYLLSDCGFDALQSFLLYKPPRNAGAKPLAQLMAERAINCGEAWQEDEIMYALREFSSDVPEVEDILLWLPAPPVRVAKDRRCAKPGCPVSGEGLYNNMKKCGRCKAVYYCSKEHQVRHWPKHRRSCVKQVVDGHQMSALDG
jgi:hypothetical protein